MRPQPVNTALTLNRTSEQDPTRRPAAPRPGRRRAGVENTDYAAMAGPALSQ